MGAMRRMAVVGYNGDEQLQSQKTLAGCNGAVQVMGQINTTYTYISFYTWQRGQIFDICLDSITMIILGVFLKSLPEYIHQVGHKAMGMYYKYLIQDKNTQV